MHDVVAPESRRLSDVSNQILQWLLTGGLSHPSGAMASWRFRDSGALAFEYPETTGYFLRAAAYAGESARPAVVKAADWLCSRLESGDLSARPGSPTVYEFDLAIIAGGLINVGKALKSDRYLSNGLSLAKRQRDQVLTSGALTTTFPSQAATPKWSTTGTSHMLKCVQVLCLARDEGVEGMREAGEKLMASSRGVTLNSPDLAFGESGPNLHAASYAIEGLWIWSQASGDTASARQAKTMLEALERAQLPSGGFPKDLGSNRAVEQSDVTPQVARLRLAIRGKDAGHPETLQRLVAIAFPVSGGMAISYQPEASEVHANSWCSMFAYQALHLASSGKPLAWQYLL